MDALITYIVTLGIDEDDINKELLLQACTHKSFSADTPDANIPHNERLEFLGDSILGARVAEELYTAYGDIAESKLTLAKIYLVKEWMLAKVARDIDLWRHIRLGNWEERSWWSKKDAILSDTLEALIAYIYIVHGRDAVASFIKKYIMSQLQDLSELPWKSRKSRLQEYVQKKTKKIPRYVDKEHEVEPSWNVLSYKTDVYIDDVIVASSIASSKKKAQESAAKAAMQQLT